MGVILKQGCVFPGRYHYKHSLNDGDVQNTARGPFAAHRGFFFGPRHMLRMTFDTRLVKKNKEIKWPISGHSNMTDCFNVMRNWEHQSRGNKRYNMSIHWKWMAISRIIFLLLCIWCRWREFVPLVCDVWYLVWVIHYKKKQHNLYFLPLKQSFRLERLWSINYWHLCNNV